MNIAYRASNIGFGAMWVVPRALDGPQDPITPPPSPSSDIAKRLKDRRDAWTKLYPDIKVIDD
jgi:hypothetical protein